MCCPEGGPRAPVHLPGGGQPPRAPPCLRLGAPLGLLGSGSPVDCLCLPVRTEARAHPEAFSSAPRREVQFQRVCPAGLGAEAGICGRQRCWGFSGEGSLTSWLSLACSGSEGRCPVQAAAWLGVGGGPAGRHAQAPGAPGRDLCSRAGGAPGTSKAQNCAPPEADSGLLGAGGGASLMSPDLRLSCSERAGTVVELQPAGKGRWPRSLRRRWGGPGPAPPSVGVRRDGVFKKPSNESGCAGFAVAASGLVVVA